MLRLLQKKFTPAQLELIKHLLFVFSAHCMLLLLLVFSTKSAQRLVLNIRTFQKSDNVVIRWRSTQKKQSLPAQVAPHVPKREPRKPIKKIKTEVPEKRFTNVNQFSKIVSQSSPIDLGKKKKRLVNSAYQVPQPPQPKVIEPVTEPAKAQPQEPLIISVHEYNEQQESSEIVEAIRRKWQPPMGVHPEALCFVMIQVSSTGVCEAIVIQQSSGIPAYDISAKSALLTCNLPKHIWGKQCVLQF